MDSAEKSALISELAQLGIKHTPEKIVKIAKQANGKIVFLEEGKSGKRGSGLLHILKEHRDDFARRGISEDEIADVVMAAVTSGKFLGYQGTVEPRREIYEVNL